jgi:uncharacterized protein (TIGR02145 family)
MQTNRILAVCATMALIFVCVPSIAALNYSIVFTASGASSTVDSVVVLNLSKGTKVTVPAGNVLSLTDGSSSVDDKSLNTQPIVIPNPIQTTSKVSFLLNKDGNVTVSVFSLDGSLLVAKSQNLQQGENSFQLTLPQGKYLLNISGSGCNYTTQVLSVNTGVSQPVVVFTGNQSLQTLPQYKVKEDAPVSFLTKMDYSEGDALLYKAYSAGYLCSIVSDTPTVSKTTNIKFVDCTDKDGNHYSAVTIGGLTWMGENLRTTKYRNGVSITNASDRTTWGSLTSGGMCTYNNITASDTIAQYGRLYNWYAASDSANIAPLGWHVATQAEWDSLISYVGIHYANSLNGAKAIASKVNWKTSTSPNVGAYPELNNSTGFNAVPAGLRGGLSGAFFSVGDGAVFWSSTSIDVNNAWGYSLSYGSSNIAKTSGSNLLGFSIRCVKD